MDYSEMNNEPNMWVFARNTTLNSQNGDILHLQNEPSTKFCAEFPYTYIGSIKLKDNRFAIFTTNNTSSEIGILNANTCTYIKVVNDPCLNFHTDNPIFGTSKENFDNSENIYWADGSRNEIRYMNLSKVPYKYEFADDSCKTKDYTDELDCDALSFTKQLSVPQIFVNKASFGSLKNGSYQFAVAYGDNDQRITDYFSVTAPMPVWNHKNSGSALELDIQDLDLDFSQYQLIVIATIEGQTFYKIIGTYPSAQNKHVVSTIDKPEFIDIPLEEISVKRTYYQKADYLTSNDQYLFLSGVSSRKKLNYQLSALDITSKYVVYRVPVDFYSKYNDVGYYRDEVYSFAIQWLYDDGEWSELFHIKGREAKDSDLTIVYGNDVFEPKSDCDYEKEVKFYQVYNTADKLKPFNVEFRTCDRTIIGEGNMAYCQSSENYPDNLAQYGKYACTPIKHHKFPDEAKVPRYFIDEDGKTYLQILGVKFNNIPHPLDENNKPLTNVRGYRIWRGDRNNNRSVIARGLLTNVREHADLQSKKLYKYSNYPYNGLKPDLFISQKQTYNKQSGEKDYDPPKIVSDTEFTFYAPHCLFDRVSLGDYITFNTQETAQVEGYFNEVFKHPKAKLLSDKALYFAILLGAIDGVLRAFLGEKVELAVKNGTVTATTATTGTPTSTTWAFNNIKLVQRANDVLKSVSNVDAGSSLVEKPLLKALGSLAKFGAFPFYMAETSQKVIDILYNITSWRQYAAQYNSKAFFNVQKIIKPGEYRRRIDSYQYLSQGLNPLVDSPGYEYNNLFKEDNVYIKVNVPVKKLTGDTSQTSISKSKTCGLLNVPIQSKASLYYGTVKRTFPNQYGQLDSIKYLSTASLFKTASKPTATTKYSTTAIFGGDCFINKFSVNNPTDLFSHPLYDVPDGFSYDYRNYRALAYPRYWADTSVYEFLNIIPTPTLTNKNSFPKESNLPRQKYNLDCKNKKGFSLINNSYFYTSINGVFEFIVESDYNLDNRDWKKQQADFYTKNNNLQKLFENKGENRELEEFIYDKSYSKQMIEEFFYQQDRTFDPSVDLSYAKNSTVYSLPSFKEQKFDNWLTFLPNNIFNFSSSQFGSLTAIKIIDDQKLIFLFDRTSPYITPGRAELKTVDNKTIYLGDGTLIREPRPLILTDDNFGNCQSRFAFNYTKFGFFYPSQRKGNIFQFQGSLNEISRDGMYFFFNKELPSKLLTYFPNYHNFDNPFTGVGLTSSYDPTYETYYLTKKDYVPKLDTITYNEQTKKFYNNAIEISLSDTRYFDDAGWTVSYNPSIKGFVSFHDYKPSDYLSSEKHFFSIINSGNRSSIHEHNVRFDSFCNFYGIDYPHSFILPINNGQNVEVLHNIEYQAETFIYNPNGIDRYHVLQSTYDKALVYNTEQCSGWLNLLQKNKSNMAEMLKYDKLNLNVNSFDIYIDKVEQKYRFNQIRDISKDRTLQEPLILTSVNGYEFVLNTNAVDYKKSIYERKKIRHTHSKLYLEKTVSGSNKHIFYLSNSKQVQSPR